MDHLIEMPFATANGIIVVRDPAAPGRTNLWIAILTGCACVSVEYFMASGARGSCMSWLPAVSVRRKIWVSSEWAASSPLLFALLRWACHDHWKYMSMTCEEFLAAQLKASNANLLGIVTCEQKAVSPFEDRKKVFAQENVLGYACKLQATESCYKHGGIDAH